MGFTELLSKFAIVARLAYWASTFIPPCGWLRKYKNSLSLIHERRSAAVVVSTMPSSVRIAISSLCNYRCLFCEIHKDEVLYPKRAATFLNLSDIVAWSSFLGDASAISFFGGSAEPLMNKAFPEIIKYLKRRFNSRLMINTNGRLLREQIADSMVDCGFDEVLLSYHAGTTEGYKKLMTGDVDAVDANIADLTRKRRDAKSNKPFLRFNFALHKANADEALVVVRKAKSLGVDEILINRYHGGRNLLSHDLVAFDLDIANGNRALDRIYAEAAVVGTALNPQRPAYWETSPSADKWSDADFDSDQVCSYPWTDLHFDPCLDSPRTFFVGQCNRIQLFRLNIDELPLDNKKNVRLLWNHPVLQYLRKTVNTASCNSLCRYCKNRCRESVRNIDESTYSRLRDDAIRRFFVEFRAHATYEEIPGLRVLEDNPDSDERYMRASAEKLIAVSGPSRNG